MPRLKSKPPRRPPSTKTRALSLAKCKPDRLDMTPTVRARLALGLTREAVFPTDYGALLAKVPGGGQRAVLAAVSSTTDPDLLPVMALYRSLTPVERKAATIDMLIAGAVAAAPPEAPIDPPKVLGAIVAELTRAKSALTSMVAAIEAPGVMKAVAVRARSFDGHQDAKLLLQTVGVAPVPKTSVTNITAGRIDARQQQANVVIQNAPRLEDITRVVSTPRILEAVNDVMDAEAE